MIRAWRREDGRYRLTYTHPPYPFGQAKEYLESMAKVEWVQDPDGAGRIVEADDLDRIRHAEKVYGVVTGPSSCGCEPTMFRWVTESEVKAGVTNAVICQICEDRYPPSTWLRSSKTRHQCDILEVCGEADEAEATYEAEFARHLRDAPKLVDASPSPA